MKLSGKQNIFAYVEDAKETILKKQYLMHLNIFFSFF